MILFCGIPSEPPLALAIEAAQAQDIEYVVFSQRLTRETEVSLHLGQGVPEGTLRTANDAWPLESFSGIYARLMDPSELPDSPKPVPGERAAQSDRAGLLQELLHQWLELSAARVVNRPSSMSSNASKPYQAQLIRAAGFLVPPTVITNEPEAALDFVRRHQRVIYKSTSSVRSIVREWTVDSERNLARIAVLPVQLQARIRGNDVRVHVVGNRVFATRVRCSAVDYRYAGRDGLGAELEPFELAEEAALRCLDLARRLQLPFCGIDLRETSAGEFYCFEVNPSPAYSYYEQSTGQPISTALVEYLDGRTG